MASETKEELIYQDKPEGPIRKVRLLIAVMWLAFGACINIHKYLFF